MFRGPNSRQFSVKNLHKKSALFTLEKRSTVAKLRDDRARGDRGLRTAIATNSTN